MFDIDKVLKILVKEVKNYQVPVVDFIEVQTKDPFKVLVATILSARTNDLTTTKACRKLFEKVNKPKDLEKLSIKEIEELIYPVGFYKNKAKFLKKLPDALKQYNYEVPKTIEELIELPGVGRKTANLVLVIAYKTPAICVDTHVHRIMNIWGYVNTKTPFETEMALRKKLPKKHWLNVNSTLVAFGQHLCRPIGPHCDVCPIEKYCPKNNIKNKTTKK